MKKIISAILAIVMIAGVSSQAFAEIVYEDIVGEKRVSVGANLSDEQKSIVYGYFGIERGSVDEIVVTIDDERSYLEGVVDNSKIGTRSLSSIYITLLEENSGLDITLNNINWLTKENYENSLITLGVTDAKVIIASPVAVSGTAALTGIFKAFENITGEQIDEASKEVATEELVTTGELADELGNEEASALVNEIKLASDELAEMDDGEAKEEIDNIASDLNITLTDEQLEKLLELARSFENIDFSGVESSLQGISDKFNDILDVGSGGFWDSIVNFFVSIKDWFVDLFTGGSDDEGLSSEDESIVSEDSGSLDSSELDSEALGDEGISSDEAEENSEEAYAESYEDSDYSSEDADINE